MNRDLVAGINAHGPIALGLSGEDLGLLRVVPRDPELGFVGDVDTVNPALLNRLLAENLIPVIATVGADVAGQAYNINADLGASAVASAIGAEKLIYLTDVDGVLADVTDPSSLMTSVNPADLHRLIEAGRISAGMLPKIDGCLQAIAGGVGSAHILNAGTRHALLVELLTEKGIGTMVTEEDV